MYAQLGNIKFDLITSFNGFDEAKSYSYAEHARIENKPKVQYTGESLRSINIKLNLHNSFCSPKTETEKLKTLADSNKPKAFILGNGEYLGQFVIEEISSTIEYTDKKGNIISISLSIKLKEWTGKIQVQSKPKQGFKIR